MNRLKLVGTAAVAAALLVPSIARAQGFEPKRNEIGFVVGLGDTGESGLAFGARFEHGIKRLPSLGDGVLAFELSVDYYGWSGFGYSWHYIPVGGTANYHVKLDNKKIDPFVGIGLGYNIVTCSFSGSGPDACHDGDLDVIGRLGMRYYYKPNMAFYGDVSNGGGTLHLGLMFKMK